MMNKSKLDELVNLSLNVLEKFLAQENPTDADNKKARAAQSLLSTYSRLEQTTSAREATRFLVARELSENKEELARFLKASTPQLIPENFGDKKSLAS